MKVNKIIQIKIKCVTKINGEQLRIEQNKKQNIKNERTNIVYI